ncbi:MAG: tetratricopeptide repeat protein [Nanoarchaeota archaeon]|nr:tetratricopeptide repeat protein [Nanoarchaeota archaeon]
MIESIINSLENTSRPSEQNINRKDFFKTAGLGLLAVGASSCAPLISSRKGSAHRYQPKYHTIAHEFLDLEKEFGVTGADYRFLDSIIDKAKKKIEVKEQYSKDDAVQILETIDSVLKEEGFSYKANGLLNYGLKTKKIDCDNYSVIYLAIAETLNLPIVGVDASDHFFVRWDPDGKHDATNSPNKVNSFNWEITSAEVLSDDYYKSRFNIADKSITNGVFLKSLNRDGVLSIQYSNRGIAWYKKGDLDKAIEDYNKAISLNPKYPGAYNNRGLAWYDKRYLNEAIEDFDEAIRLEPNNYAAHNNTGLVWAKRGKLDKAIEYYEQANILNPKKYGAHHNRGNALRHKGYLNEAIEAYDKAIRLNPKHADSYNNRGIIWEMKGEIDKANKDFRIAQRLNE